MKRRYFLAAIPAVAFVVKALPEPGTVSLVYSGGWRAGGWRVGDVISIGDVPGTFRITSVVNQWCDGTIEATRA